jgi:peptidoglycan hydrolase-like protein with peptidoglycan-binding domain
MTESERMIAAAHAERSRFLAGIGPDLAQDLGSFNLSSLTSVFTGGSSGGVDFSGEPTLTAGSKEKDSVIKLQDTLEQLGFSPGTVDGIFGSKTTAAVKAFQGSVGLSASGTVDAATWKALGDALGGSVSGKSGASSGSGKGVEAVTAGLLLGSSALNAYSAAAGSKKKGKKGKKAFVPSEPLPSSEGSILPVVIGGLVVVGLLGGVAYFMSRKSE